MMSYYDPGYYDAPSYNAGFEDGVLKGRAERDGEALAAIYAHEWKIDPDGRAVIDVPWLLRLLNDPRAEPSND